MNAGRLAAVIGSPVAHSLSPVIHRAAFAAAGVDWSYVAFEVAPGAGAAAVESMRTLGIAGLSVTMPHKADVAAAVDELEPPAVALGAVNTVSWSGDRLVGSSTDGDGFVSSLAAEGVGVTGIAVAVIGAGGAARSVIDALGRAGAGSIRVVNRTADNAERAASLAAVAEVGEPADVGTADLVVNATSVGMGDSGDLACAPDLLRCDQVVADLVYHPLETPLLAAAAERGARTIDGLGMLVHQAALQQQRWLGTLPDVAAMRAAAESELATRRPA
ncbi:MAG: shikimate dehydrogenase [Ilumatobacteraceae bacterium]